MRRVVVIPRRIDGFHDRTPTLVGSAFQPRVVNTKSISINVQPTNHTKDLVSFVNESWMTGIIRVSAGIPSIRVRGGKTHERTWRGSLGAERSNVSIAVCTKSESHPTCSALLFNSPSTVPPWPSASRKRYTVPPVLTTGHIEGLPYLFQPQPASS